MVVLTKLGWRASLFLLEDTVEIAEVVETTFEGYFRDGPCRVHQHTRGIAQTYVDDILREVAPRVQFKETAESTGTHARYVGQGRQAQLVAIVLRYKILDFQHAATIILDGYLGITA